MSGIKLDDGGTTALTGFTVESDILITGAVVPAGIVVGSYNVQVTTGADANATSAVLFDVTTPAPTVTNLDPNTGSNLGTTTIDITGMGFFGGTTSSSVTAVNLDDPASTEITVYTVSSNTLITGAIVPAGVEAGVYNVCVTTAGGTNTTSVVQFTVTTPGPTVTSIGPSTGSNIGTTSIDITGTGFFGGTASPNVSAIELDDPSTTSLTGWTVTTGTTIIGAVVPAGVIVGSYNVKVTTNGGTNLTSGCDNKLY